MTTNQDIPTSSASGSCAGVNVNDLCRLCLNREENKIEIWGEVGQQMNISETIWILFNSSVLENDRWPQNICIPCCEKLTEFHAFYSTVKSTEATLVGLYGQRELPESSSIKVEVDIFSPSDDDEDFTQDDEKKSDDSYVKVKEEVFANVLETVQDTEEAPDDAVEPLEEEDEEKPKRRRKSPKTRSARKLKQSPEPEIEIIPQNRVDHEITKFIKIFCELCNKVFPIFEELKIHFKLVHHQEGYVMCCNRRINTRSRLLEHVNYHKDPEKCVCKVCGKIFHFPQSIQRHIARHVANDDKRFKCDQCPKVFSTSAYMRRHMRWHAPPEEKQRACPQCNKMFASHQVMRMHVERVHELKDKRVCEICAKEFKCRESFAMHQLKHTGEKPPERECEHCGQKFTSRSAQRRHMERHKEPSETFSCDVCGREFIRKYLLQKHKSSAHRKRLFKCNLCEKEFKQALNLREHVATHTGQQSLYKCNFCDKMFNSNANRYVHQKRNHPEEWEEERRKKLLGTSGGT